MQISAKTDPEFWLELTCTQTRLSQRSGQEFKKNFFAYFYYKTMDKEKHLCPFLFKKSRCIYSCIVLMCGKNIHKDAGSVTLDSTLVLACKISHFLFVSLSMVLKYSITHKVLIVLHLFLLTLTSSSRLNCTVLL